MSVRGNVIRRTVHRGNVRSGNCRSGNCPSGKCPSGKCPSGKVLRGKVSRGTVLIPFRGKRKGALGTIAQHCLVAMLEKWKSCNDKGKSFGALMTDLSKAFDCLSHELIVTKLHAYGFDK